MRSFAKRTNRSDLRIVSRSNGQTVKTVKPHSFYRYHGNAAAVDAKALKRRK